MGDERWQVPRTQTGLRTLLERLEESRLAGDDRAVGYGLLALSWLVKWVPWNGEGTPFGQSADLVDEALAIFRRIGDEPGVLAALTASTPFDGREQFEERLREAEEIADRLGDDLSRASVLHTKSRFIGLRDRNIAVAMSAEAADLYLRNGKTGSAAACQLSVSIYTEDHDGKATAALESARLYREIGNRREAARAASLVLMFCDHWPTERLAPIVREGLTDALAGVDASLESIFYSHLAKVCTAEGDTEGALDAADRKERLANHDGLTPKERRANDVAMTKMMIEFPRSMGNAEAVEAFEARLKEIRRTRSSRRKPSSNG